MPASADGQTIASRTEPVDYECGLCYEKFTNEHSLVPLDNCRHVFGNQCLKAWMPSKNDQRDNCPECRALIFNEIRTKVVSVQPAIVQHLKDFPANLPARSKAPLAAATLGIRDRLHNAFRRNERRDEPRKLIKAKTASALASKHPRMPFETDGENQHPLVHAPTSGPARYIATSVLEFDHRARACDGRDINFSLFHFNYERRY